MNIEVVADSAALAERAGLRIANLLRGLVALRTRVGFAVSGGRTPAAMLEVLARSELPWERIEIFQVDERMAPAGHPERNLELLRAHLLERLPPPRPRVRPMPVEQADLDAAAATYAAELQAACGDPPALDVVQLGLGSDGHTASLVPGDAALEATGDAAVTAPYQGWRRMTLTAPALSRARHLVWVVGGADKADAVARLVAGDPSIPASRVDHPRAVLLVDRAAAAQLDPDAQTRMHTRTGKEQA